MKRLSVWPPLPLARLVPRRAALPFPLGRSGCRLHVRARHGIWDGVRALGLGPGDEVLTPAYHHGSEIEALVRAGLSCRFYEGNGALDPDESELQSLIGDRTRALHLTHFMGFPQDALRWRRWCDQHGLLLIEDAAQAWLAEVDGHPVGSFGDLAVFCLYKSVGLPVVSASITAAESSERRRRRDLGVLRLARFAAGRVLARFPELERLLRGPRGPYDPAEDFALGSADSSPPALMELLVRRHCYAGVASKRRRNYARMLDELDYLVPEPFHTLAVGASPFVFPIAVEQKEALLGRLAEDGIDGLNFWSVPHPALAIGDFPGAARRRSSVIGLPVHQALRADEVDRIVDVVHQAGTHRTR